MGLTEAIRVAAVANESSIVGEIRKFFSRYGPTVGSQRAARFLRCAVTIHWLELPHGYERRRGHHRRGRDGW